MEKWKVAAGTLHPPYCVPFLKGWSANKVNSAPAAWDGKNQMKEMQEGSPQKKQKARVQKSRLQ